MGAQGHDSKLILYCKVDDKKQKVRFKAYLRIAFQEIVLNGTSRKKNSALEPWLSSH